ncbi:hypothetical protein SDC9_152206 [bioreactor metagenome]|uniref:Fatty acid kinase subunit A-like C-terminal domain-containing protein n=1 Tax=bioreactor metagenome TaxID=1076179 RepID=A0A645ET00_9ZZZZ
MIEEVIPDLIKQADADQTGEMMTIFYGEDVDQAKADRVLELLKKTFGRRYEYTMINGKQPVYQYIVSIE